MPLATQKKRLPVGISDFEEVIAQNYYFVDKSLLIKEIFDSGAKVTLIPRPRRFGKTLNLSMIRCFFEKVEESKAHLFNSLKITEHPEIMKNQGQSPVIFLTFKDVKQDNWQICYEKMRELIGNEFYRHNYLNNSNLLNSIQQKNFKAVIDGTATQAVYENSLKNLSEYLAKYHNKKPVMLIDEYDAPVHASFINNYYTEAINFMRGLLCAGVKDNPSLQFCILSGILRVAKESIFSGLNNLEVCSLLSNRYADKFGLLENEVEQILYDYDLSKKEAQQIKSWYDGYKAGNQMIYNPWSIINLVKSEGQIQPYWINTSSNDIIKELIKNGSDELKENVELLISGESINKPIYENIVFAEIFTNMEILWSFLLFSGYLTFENKKLKKKVIHADLKIPNTEVEYFYENTISNWFVECYGAGKYNLMLKSLISGNIEAFQEIFSDFVLKSFSVFDISGKEPEKFYHAFVLGILVSLQSTHQIKSNRESGFGRYDVMIIPKDKNQIGIVIEFKKVSYFRKETLEDAAHSALKQIEERQYEQELLDLGIKKIIKLAIVFDGKKVLIQEG